MAGTGVGKFSSTAGSNTANMTVNFAENMAPSNVNNAARELMGHMRDMYEQLGDGYFEFGDGDGTYTVARSDADTITITSSSDISSVYFAGRKIRITDGGANVVEGTIASSSHSSTTQTVNLTGISLASGTPTKVELGIDTASFGGRVILDDDGDTYIEAPTDDTIDIYVAGAKDFVITANTFTAESGSTIAAQALTATTITTTGAIAIANDGNIGSAGDADAIAISSSGVVTFSQAPVFPDGSIAVADLDIDGATDIGAAIVDADLFIIDDGAGGTNRKVTASRLKTYAGGALAGIDDQSSSNDDQLTITDTAVIINEDSDDVDFRVESNGNANMLFVSGGNDVVGIGAEGDLGVGLHIKTADSSGDVHATGDELVLENSGDCGMTILSGTSNHGRISFGDSGDNNIGYITYDHGANGMSFITNASTQMFLNSNGCLMLNESATEHDDGLVINQGANDGKIISLKSSDVAHGMTGSCETDTYAHFGKQSATKGGVNFRIYTEDMDSERLNLNVQGEGDLSETKSTSGKGAMAFGVSAKSGTAQGATNNDGILLSIANYTNTRFLFEGDGNFHADAGSNTYDAYEDAQLARAYDLSHGKGVIESKFDKFVAYNHEKLAQLDLVGREEDGTPNHFINVTGMQRLHNGAIWQQYEKHQRLANAVYELAKAAVGEDKANEILEQNEIKLLN